MLRRGSARGGLTPPNSGQFGRDRPRWSCGRVPGSAIRCEVGSGADQKVLAQGSPQWYSVLLTRMQATQSSSSRPRCHRRDADPTPIRPVTRPRTDANFARLNSLLTDFAARTPHVRVIDLAARVCPSGPPCPRVVDNVWVRGDGAHYTSEGSLWVARWLMPQLGIAALDTPNNSLPVMKMVGLANGAVVKGTRPLVATAAYQFGVARVEFEITGSGRTSLGHRAGQDREGLVGACTGTPRTFRTASTSFEASPTTQQGNRSISRGITVRVAN